MATTHQTRSRRINLRATTPQETLIRAGAKVRGVNMTDFILDGHFARHLRRMRSLYAERQDFLVEQVARRLGGLLDIGPRESGMYLVAWLPPDCSDRAAAAALAAAGISALPLSALTLATARPPGLVLGYTGHGEAAMARAVERMATVLEGKTGLIDPTKLDLR